MGRVTAMLIPVRVPAGAKPVLASERRMAAHRGHPLDPYPCPVCDEPLGDGVIVLILAGIHEEDRKPAGWTTGMAVAVHALCAGVPEEEPEGDAEPPRTVTFDLSGPDALFVLTEALGRFETYQADRARDDNEEDRTRWAALAGRMREQAEKAFSGGTEG